MQHSGNFLQLVGVILRPNEHMAREARHALASRLESVPLHAGWREYEVVSNDALADEITDGPFSYRLYALFGSTLVALVGVSHALMLFARNKVLHDYQDALHEVAIDVDGVVDDVASGTQYVVVGPDRRERTVRYLLTSLHAKTPGLGIDVRSLSMYGDNITGGSIFRDYRRLLNITSCGLRRSSTKELVKIGADGSLTVQVHVRWLGQRLQDLTDVLGYVVSRGRILTAHSPSIATDPR